VIIAARSLLREVSQNISFCDAKTAITKRMSPGNIISVPSGHQKSYTSVIRKRTSPGMAAQADLVLPCTLKILLSYHIRHRAVQQLMLLLLQELMPQSRLLLELSSLIRRCYQLKSCSAFRGRCIAWLQRNNAEGCSCIVIAPTFKRITQMVN
jgi:hypothetical protein